MVRTRRQERLSSLTTLLSLPYELLEMIGDYSRPDGFESYVLSCHQIFDACQRLISKHNKLKRKWRIMACIKHRIEHHHRPGIQTAGVINLLQDLYQTPLAADYVRHATIRNWSCRATGDTEDLALNAALEDEKFMAHITKVKNDIFDFTAYGDYVDDLIQDWKIRPGRKIPEFEWMLLLVQLPNLRSILFDNIIQPSFGMLGDLAECFSGITNKNTLRTHGIVPFQNLRHLEIHVCGREIEDPTHAEITSLSRISGFRALPNLRVLRGCYFRGRSNDTSRYHVCGAACNDVLEEFEAIASLITQRHIKAFLNSIVNLKRFFYVHSCHGRIGSDALWNGARFVKALQSETAGSLEVLGLALRDEMSIQTGDRPETMTPVTSFTGFKKLRYLDIDIRLLRGPHPEMEESDSSDADSEDPYADIASDFSDEEEEHYDVPEKPLVDMLPASLQELRLMTSEPGYDKPILQILFEGITDRERLPELRRIIVDARHYNQSTAAQMRWIGETSFRKKCRKAGIKFEYRTSSIKEHWNYHEMHGRALSLSC